MAFIFQRYAELSVIKKLYCAPPKTAFSRSLVSFEDAGKVNEIIRACSKEIGLMQNWKNMHLPLIAARKKVLSQ